MLKTFCKELVEYSIKSALGTVVTIGTLAFIGGFKEKIEKYLNIEVSCVYGGSAIGSQISELRRGREIVVATPGRFIEILCLSNGKITNLRRVSNIIYDDLGDVCCTR